MAILNTPYGNIYYNVLGDGETTIGFMNGVMASASSWDTYVDVFVKLGFKVVTFDFIGQMLSDKPQGPYTFKQHIDEAKRLYDSLGIESLHLIGTSYGSEVAMKFALTYPQSVLSLSLIDGTAEIDEPMKKEILRWYDLTNKSGEEFFWGMAPSIYHPDYIAKNHDFLEARAKKLNGAHDYLAGQRALYETFLNEVHFLNELHEIDTPTLVVVGEFDTLKPPSCSQAIHDQIKGSEYVVLPNCGHVGIFEKADELITLLVGFILKKENRI